MRSACAADNIGARKNRLSLLHATRINRGRDTKKDLPMLHRFITNAAYGFLLAVAIASVGSNAFTLTGALGASA